MTLITNHFALIENLFYFINTLLILIENNAALIRTHLLLMYSRSILIESHCTKMAFKIFTMPLERFKIRLKTYKMN